MNLSGFSDFSGFDATGADERPPYGSGGQNDADALKIREKAPAGNAGDLFSDPALFLGHTPSCD